MEEVQENARVPAVLARVPAAQRGYPERSDPGDLRATVNAASNLNAASGSKQRHGVSTPTLQITYAMRNARPVLVERRFFLR